MYEVMRYWDDDHPDWTSEQHDFAVAWRRQPKWVVSRSSESVGLPIDWVVTATIKLGHAAGERIAAGEMSEREVVATLRTTLLRILGPNVAHDWPAP